MLSIITPQQINLQMSAYKISVEDSEFNLDIHSLDTLNIYEKSTKQLHILHENKSFHVELLDEDWERRTLYMRINGNPYQVTIADKYDQLVRQMGLLEKSSQKLNNIKAPMPGLIVDILVEVGQEVTKGTPIVILSAMKMENMIAAKGDGVVKQITVKKDEAVEKGQLLIEIA